MEHLHTPARPVSTHICGHTWPAHANIKRLGGRGPGVCGGRGGVFLAADFVQHESSVGVPVTHFLLLQQHKLVRSQESLGWSRLKSLRFTRVLEDPRESRGSRLRIQKALGESRLRLHQVQLGLAGSRRCRSRASRPRGI